MKATHGWSRQAVVIVVLLFVATVVWGAHSGYHKTADGVSVYFAIVPAELIRGHPPEHTEAIMHGGVPVGESHLTVAVYDAKSGRRISNAAVSARITDDRGLNMRKTLEPMLIADSPTFGNYVSMRGAGPYRIEIEIRVPGRTKAVIVTFTWARS